MKSLHKNYLIPLYVILISILASGCSTASTVNTPDANLIFTQSAQTLEAMLTQSAGVEDVATQTPVPILPTATLSPTATPTQTLKSEQAFCNWVAFVKDVTFPDGSILSPEASFVKTWRLKNKGTCSWTSAYSLVFMSGDQMSGPLSISLPRNINPGETFDISVTLTAPKAEGDYKGYWMLQNPSGINFGYGDQANKAFFVDITSASATSTPKPLLVWQNYAASPCEKAIFSLEELAYGECENVLAAIPSANSGHLPRLLDLVNTYGAFTANTAAGTITLNGTGSKIATQAEQRAISEWANLKFQVAKAGRAGAAWGLAFTWHREGGIAGFCDDVTVYVTGQASLSNCSGLNRKIYLNSSQLEQLYGWVDTFNNIDYAYTDPAITDSMTITLVLSGNGNRQANQTEIQAISDFASTLMSTVQ